MTGAQGKAPPPDPHIKQAVASQLSWDGRIDDSDIHIGLRDGEVTLTGTVQSHAARRAALLNAWSVLGVRNVVDKLAVRRSPAGPAPGDADVKHAAGSVLLWNREIDASAVEVDVEDGVVTLSGSVDAYWKKLAAEELVADLDGVAQVVDKLAVVPTRSVRDEVIAEDITRALDRSTAVDAGAINVSVERGVVTLAGDVGDWTALRSARDCATYARGVTDVRNNIVVRAERAG